MKAVLRLSLLAVLLSMVTTHKATAQCTVSDLLIQNLVPVGTQTPGSCTATFDISFNIEANNGNKFIFLHVFTEADYPDYFQCVNGVPGINGAISPPEAPDLVDAFINIGIDNSGIIPLLLTSYPPDPSVTLNTAVSVIKTVLPDGSLSFVIQNVQATFPADCNTPILLAGDVWSTQSASANVAQCVNCHIAFAVNFMSLAGFANCANLTFGATLTNQIGSSLGGYYQVYADANFDGVLSFSNDSLIRDTTNFTIGAGVGSTFSINGSIPPVNINQNLFLVVTLTSGVGSGSVIILPLISTQCIPLPVSFGPFTAKRVNSGTVHLQWQTFTEINNNGFAIERNMGDGIWTTVGFVPTQAANSTITLNYSFTDPNTNRNITQYRLRQVDNDSRIKYSEIRIVRGYDQSGELLVYPNPSFNGGVNVVFDDKGDSRDIIISDSYGRVVRQWKNLGVNTLYISNLPSGTYILRMTNRDDGKQTTAKFVVLGSGGE